MCLGQIVEWTSSSAGVTRTKRGEIVIIAAAGSRVRGVGRTGKRNHESYIVRARVLIDGIPHGGERCYWPRVSQLKEVKP